MKFFFKKVKKKKLTSTAITLYASVSDNAPGNESRRLRIRGLSATVATAASDGRDDGERYRADTGLILIISDLDRWRVRSGLRMPSIAYSSSCTCANSLDSDDGVIPEDENA